MSSLQNDLGSSLRCASIASQIDHPDVDVDVDAMTRKVGDDSAVSMPVTQTRQQRRDADVVIYAPYACVADCADDMADAWADTFVIQSPQARRPLDRMCVHVGDGQTYLVRVDSMS